MWSSIRPAFIITWREIRDQFRDWRIIMPIIGLTLIFPGLMNFTAERVVSYVESFDAPLIGDRLIPFLLMIVGFFPISVSLVIALESFVGEKERRSIEPLLASPLTDTQLYLGKLLAVFVPPLISSYLAIGVYLFGVYNQVGWVPDPVLLVQVVLLATVQSLLMVSGAVVVSTQTTSTRAANLLASFIIIPMALLLIGESLIMFWARYNVLWWAIFGQVIIAGLLIRTGVAYFNREELLGRELDTLNLKWAWRTFASAFKGNARSLREWLRVEIPATTRRNIIPTLIVGAVILAALAIGAFESSQLMIPPELIAWEKMEEGFLEGIEEFQFLRFFSVEGAAYIVFHNLRTLAGAALVGVFSFGTLAILVIMLPFVLIGFVMAAAAQTGLSPVSFFAAFVLPHGIFEIPALMMAGAAILRLGAVLATPAEGKTIGEAWLFTLADFVRTLLVWVIPLLILAALAEVFLTPRAVMWMLSGAL